MTTAHLLDCSVQFAGVHASYCEVYAFPAPEEEEKSTDSHPSLDSRLEYSPEDAIVPAEGEMAFEVVVSSCAFEATFSLPAMRTHARAALEKRAFDSFRDICASVQAVEVDYGIAIQRGHDVYIGNPRDPQTWKSGYVYLEKDESDDPEQFEHYESHEVREIRFRYDDGTTEKFDLTVDAARQEALHRLS